MSTTAASLCSLASTIADNGTESTATVRPDTLSSFSGVFAYFNLPHSRSPFDSTNDISFSVIKKSEFMACLLCSACQSVCSHDQLV